MLEINVVTDQCDLIFPSNMTMLQSCVTFLLPVQSDKNGEIYIFFKKGLSQSFVTLTLSSMKKNKDIKSGTLNTFWTKMFLLAFMSLNKCFGVFMLESKLV